MMRTNVYIPEELNKQIDRVARFQKKSKATIIREALEEGMKEKNSVQAGSAKALLDMAKAAEKLDVSGPKDLSINHDHYTWGGPKRDPNAQV